MERVAYKTIIAAAAAWLILSPMARSADEDPVKSIALLLEGSCDPKNSRLFAESKHATRTIVATLRWSLSGSKRVATDQFQIAPGAKVEIGCAAQADIVSAVFLQ